ncbi:MAG: endonuclease III [Actinobacteria bacterium]|nr:endonuclease III [Actinomycetota bacterium]MBM3713557.1 endonuclease III [Actinomycetota bacterium]
MKKAHYEVYKPAINNISRILKILDEYYPQSTHTSLEHKNAFQLLVATILSAQSTDKLVNRLTPELFKKYKKPKDFANASLFELENDIRSTGFFHNKAKNIIACSKGIVERFNSKIPDNINDLITLAGVGRKTANVVLANVYGRAAIIVDTHVHRITQRIGLTVNTNPDKIEYDVMKIIPENCWTAFSHQIIAHGRAICDAKKPKCPICRLLPYCRFGQENSSA